MTNETKRRFAEKLRSVRTGLSLTQRQAADRLDWTAAYWSMLESGERNPSLVTVRRIADALDVSVAELMEDV